MVKYANLRVRLLVSRFQNVSYRGINFHRKWRIVWHAHISQTSTNIKRTSKYVMTYVLLEQYAKHHEHVHTNALSQAGYFDINITTHTMHREQVLSQTFKSRFTWLNHARSDWHKTWCHHNCNTITWPFHVEIVFFSRFVSTGVPIHMP